MSETITVDIDATGKSTIDVKGHKGKSCADLTAGLERVLGGEVETKEFTREAAERPQPEQQRKLKS